MKRNDALKTRGQNGVGQFGLWCSVLGVMALSASGVLAQEAGAAPAAAAAAPAAEGASETYLVGKIVLKYHRETIGQPSLDSLSDVQVALSKQADGSYDAPIENSDQNVAITIGQGFEPAARLRPGAIREIAKRINSVMNEDFGIIGTLVTPSETSLRSVGGTSYEDARGGDTTLVMEVWTATIQQVRTIGSGPRLSDADQRIDSELHTRIMQRSPVKTGDIIDGDALRGYVNRLNRQPGRRVDVALGPALAPERADDTEGKTESRRDEAVLDYLITENKPWYLYAQVSNTGTRETNEWRQRIGFTHNQVTNSDDIFRLDYLTANFADTNAILASYERPVWGDRLRGRIFGQASEFTASDVGALRQKFTGESWQAGGELIFNVAQFENVFIDLIGGARWLNTHVKNQITSGFAIRGTENFFIPYGGARLVRDTAFSSSSAAVTLEQSVSAISGSENDLASSQIKRLGRLNPNNDWTLLKWDAEQSFYLEPLLNGWGADVSKTLAHELAFSVRGQYAFGARLIPTESSTVGGLYTVRGYRESLTSGDSTIVGSAEYRFHLPRMFGVSDAGDSDLPTLFGKPFRERPAGEYGRPDWDLVFRAFFDAGATDVSDKTGIEANHTLMSTGLGVDFQIRNNITLRLDWGVPLTTVENIDDPINSGESRLHFVATFVY